MGTKHYKRIDFNTTTQIKSSSILDRLTGKNDLIFLRNKWQTELDNSWAALMNMTHYIEECDDSNQVIRRFNDIARFRGEIKDANVKRHKLYENVFKYIQKDQEYSERMWRIHQDMYKSAPSATGNYSTSLKNINITREEVRRYVERYPSIEIKNDIQLIKDIEKGIERKKSDYRQNISLLRDYFEQFKLELIKLESKYKAYLSVYEEGKKQLEFCNFNNCFLFNLMSAEKKHSLKLDTTTHRLIQVENTMEHYRVLRAKVEKELEVESNNHKKAVAGEFEFSEDLESI